MDSKFHPERQLLLLLRGLGALGGKCSETMCEGERVTGPARRDLCAPCGCRERCEDERAGKDRSWSMLKIRERKKSRGGAKVSEKSE